MLRSLLVGLIAISVAPACKGGSDAPVVQPGVTVGKVIDIEGNVTATRGGDPRVLTAGAEISGDDVIQTSDGASVRIWLSHNNATWTLGGGKSGKVGESAAWTAARVDHAPPGVDEATVAAGRHAEKSAADTSASAMGSKPADEGAKHQDQPSPPAPAATQPGATTAPGGGGPSGGEDRGDEGTASTGSVQKGSPSSARQPTLPAPTAEPTPPPPTAEPTPPPPPPPPPERPSAKRPEAERGVAPADDIGPAPGARATRGATVGATQEPAADEAKKATGSRASSEIGGAVAITIESLVPDQRSAMAACLEATTKIVITVKAHVVTIIGQGASAKATTCLVRFAPKFKTAVDGTFGFELAK